MNGRSRAVPPAPALTGVVPRTPGAIRDRFSESARLALGAALTGGIAAALGPVVPSAVRSSLLVAALAGWTVAVAAASVIAVRALLRERPFGYTAMGVIGIGLATFAVVELELVRLIANRPALTWNVDWRYALSHAQAIARTGGLDAALDYAGAPIEYHVGPAWFAGATQRLLGGGLTLVLFGLVPLLCALTFAIAGVHLLRGLGISGRRAIAATGLVMALPGIAATLPLTAYCFLLTSCRVSPVLWTFSHAMVPNSFHGLVVGLAALALLVERDAVAGRLALASIGLGTLVVIKPQAFVGYGLLTALIGIAALLGVGGLTRRTGRILVAAILAACIAAACLSQLPHVTQHFAGPVWAPGDTEFAFNEDRHLPTMLLIGALLGAAGFLREHPRHRTLMLLTAASLFLLAAFWSLVAFPLRPEVVSRMVELGADPTQRADFTSSLQPLRVLLALLAATAIVASVEALRGRWRGVTRAAGWAVALSPVLFIGHALASPLEAYEADEDRDLLAVLEQFPPDAERLVASDLSDAAEDHRRGLRGFSLTAYTGQPFFVANLQYVHHVQPDAPDRMRELRTFFGSRWTGWHSNWLIERRIGGVLVSARCRPVWLDQRGLPLMKRASVGRWTGFEVIRVAAADSVGPPTWKHVLPAYGKAGCLTGRPSEPPPPQAQGEASAGDRASEGSGTARGSAP